MSSIVLIVDDEQNVLRSIRRTLRSVDCTVVTATSGAAGLDIMRTHEVAVVLSDQRMPHMTGAEFLSQSREFSPNTICIALTQQADLKVVQDSVNTGQVKRLILKPWDDKELQTVVHESIQEYLEHQTQRQDQLRAQNERDQFEGWNRILERRVNERTEALYAAYDDTLDALVFALDSRESESGGHSRRVAAQTLFLACEVGFPTDDLEQVFRGALLHDIGKIGVPDAILLKPGRLDPEERKIMEEHVVIGERMLERIGYLAPAMGIPRFHHERYDGTGYARGLRGEAIPIEARIFALIDVYDALRSLRPYKDPMSHEKATAIIEEDRGKHFDPVITNVFLQYPETVWNELADLVDEDHRFLQLLAAVERVRRKHNMTNQANAA